MDQSETQRVLDASGFSQSSLHSVIWEFWFVWMFSDCLESECGALNIYLLQVEYIMLINAVLIFIHLCWAQIMPFPKTILQQINSICRSFLWKYVVEYGGSGYVAWTNLCKPKKEEGLGFRKIMTWNKAVLGKYVWVVALKQDTLWVKWVHNVYLKNRPWWSYNSTINNSWYWRQIVRVKEEIK